MKSQVLLLLITIGCLCDAGQAYYTNDQFLTSDSEEFSDSVEEDKPSCGRIVSPNGAQFGMFRTAERAVGVSDTTYNELPWMIALFVKDASARWCLQCSGTLISLKVGLTSADAVYPQRQDKMKIRAGDWNLDTYDELLPYQERLVVKIIVHPLYQYMPNSQSIYDVALLVVESPFMLADNVGFICLPPPNLHVTSPSCKVAGWGANENQTLIKVIETNYVDRDNCRRVFSAPQFSRFVLNGNFTCASGVLNKGVCPGDAGSLLMCLDGDHYYVRGIVAWTFCYSNVKFPEIYTDIVNVRQWIDQEMRGNGFDTSSYSHKFKNKFN